MAASSSSSMAKMISNFSVSILTRRGYASSAAVGESSSKTLMNNNKKKSPVSWVPDPKTGYYMPENRIHQQQQLDRDVVAEILIKNNNKN
ncbi:late embryogenesis abundant protein Lea5-like [Impatiens glandulifera]|uniref:late embryogenesis abundant protein Lea5-like n=1 Tax=Impatiens glandulifera TaxID=253017 RepID=UPI001FB15E27|nr:late embryogenesis abundant protein Lea5-like [Impatiens glandulifera]